MSALWHTFRGQAISMFALTFPFFLSSVSWSARYAWLTGVLSSPKRVCSPAPHTDSRGFGEAFHSPPESPCHGFGWPLACPSQHHSICQLKYRLSLLPARCCCVGQWPWVSDQMSLTELWRQELKHHTLCSHYQDSVVLPV